MAQLVLITAGAAGIGRAMARAFSEAGASVWITDVDAVALAAAPGDWRASEVDAADAAGMAALFAEIESDWGGLDTLCANAGIAGPTAAIEDMPPEGFRRCVEVNLDGAFLAAHHAAPMMKRAGRGAMLFTSSTAGLHGFPNRAPYAAAKWAVIGLMKTVAMELGPFGVRANAICPGSVEGPRIDGVLERSAAMKGTDAATLREAWKKGISMRSLVRAEDIANMAVFLASDAARLVSGQVIAVDGHTENPDPKV